MMVEQILHASDSMVFDGAGDDENGIDLGNLRQLVQRAIDRDVDAVVHTGNLFRSPEPSPEAIETVRRIFGQLDDAGIPVFLIEGPREAAGSNGTIEHLREEPGIHGLSADPTLIGDVALYGVDHVDTETKLREALAELHPTEEFTHNVVALNQAIWPPPSRSDADISAFDAMESTDVFVDEVLAGGADEPESWEHDDFDYRVSYAGSTNPERREGVPTATLLTADADEHDSQRIPLTRTEVTEELEQLRTALQHEPADLGSTDVESLADLYGLAARAKDHFDARRTEIREELLDRVKADERIEGEHATVTRTTSQRRVTKPEREVFQALRRAGVNPFDVLELDSSALRELSEEGTIEDEEVFDREERTYVRVSDTEV